MTEDKKIKNTDQSLPSPQISTLIMSIASAAVIKMGLNPDSKEEKDLNLARFNIDLLQVLKEKTKNNLNKEEEQLLDSCISDLQIQFVNVQNKKDA